LCSYVPSVYTATPEDYPLSLHDALPICRQRRQRLQQLLIVVQPARLEEAAGQGFQPLLQARHLRPDLAGKRKGQQRHEAVGFHLDRKSTRLNSSHVKISYAVFCLKQKNT